MGSKAGTGFGDIVGSGVNKRLGKRTNLVNYTKYV